MKIAISSQGTELSSYVDSRFGRAPYFIVYETDSGDFQVVPNDQNLNARQGAGIQAAQNVAATGADIVVSGNLGPKAFNVLTAAGIKTCLWAAGTVSEAIELVIADKLQPSDGANVEGHWM